MGNGSYLHRGSQELSIALENSLENSGVPPNWFPLDQEKEGNTKRSPTAGSVREGTISNWENLSLRPGPEYFPLWKKGEAYVLGSSLECFS